MTALTCSPPERMITSNWSPGYVASWRSLSQNTLNLAGPPEGGFSFEGIAFIVPHGKNKSDLQTDL